MEKHGTQNNCSLIVLKQYLNTASMKHSQS
uniref:GRAS49 n=1 Tax=Arundo donax TaxID=35708 RepID=A0A0A9GQF6_ARUDO